MENVTKVLLVDDHALFRSGLASILSPEQGFEVVGEATNGREALEKVQVLKPDIILMDIYMPKMGGLEATQRIKEILPDTKIVMLTISEEEKDLFDAIKMGAQGYLLKKIDPEELFQYLRGMLRGEAPMSRNFASKLLDEFARMSRSEMSKNNHHGKLSAREQEVLEHLTQGVSNKEIAAALGISENTVKNHLKSILDKLHLQNRVQAATYAIREGLVEGQKRHP